MWSVEYLNKDVFAEMEAQPRDVRAKFERIVRLIQVNGLERVHEPYIRHLEGKLWEMRLKGRDTIARAIYVTTRPKRIIVVRVFTKKTRTTPRREIEMARERIAEVYP